MSNCIEIVKGSNIVRFNSDDIDIDKVREYLKRADQSKGKHVWESGKNAEDKFNDSLWWFFSHSNVSIDDMGVVVRFGEGQSTHTWRDFDWVLDQAIKPIMKRSKVHVFCTRDEFDGFDSEERWAHDFYEGTPPPPEFKSKGKLTVTEVPSSIKKKPDKELVEVRTVTIKVG